jgi:general stress protein 26
MPTPKPIHPSELPDLARSVIRKAKFPQLATIDGDQPRLRPVSPVRVDEDSFTIYLANLRSYHKTSEIAANPKVELCYLDADHDQVRISGVAQTIEDPELKLDLWDSNPLLAQYLGTVDNPELVFYQITPTRIRFMREWALDYHEIPIAE